MNSRRIGTLVSAISAALMALALAAPGAFADTPAEGYEQFAGCPSPEENPEITLCTTSTITGGHFQMGSKDVPIKNPMTLSGGINVDGEIFASPAGGLSKAKQKVPGGVIGLTGLTWLLELFGSEALTLYATTELAGQPVSNVLLDPIILPIRVHLENSLLGNNCYVGSFSNPITLTLTTGTTEPPLPNEPISGHFFTSFEESADPIIGFFNDAEYVDNSFSAPGANGCVLNLFGIPISINGLVNEQSGLPAAAGTNETRQELDLEISPVSAVYP